MKKFLLSIVAIFGITAAASAASPEIYVGYGGYTQMDATNMRAHTAATNNAWGAITAGADFKVLPKLYVGPSYTFSSQTYKGDSGNHAYYHVVMLNGRYQFFSNNLVTLYAHAGLGADITHVSQGDYKKNHGYVAYQISPIAAQVGLGHGFTLYGELGFGAQGLMQFGVRYNL